jgi:hypothetical protein
MDRESDGATRGAGQAHRIITSGKRKKGESGYARSPLLWLALPVLPAAPLQKLVIVGAPSSSDPLDQPRDKKKAGLATGPKVLGEDA